MLVEFQPIWIHGSHLQLMVGKAVKQICPQGTGQRCTPATMVLKQHSSSNANSTLFPSRAWPPPFSSEKSQFQWETCLREPVHWFDGVFWFVQDAFMGGGGEIYIYAVLQFFVGPNTMMCPKLCWNFFQNQVFKNFGILENGLNLAELRRDYCKTVIRRPAEIPVAAKLNSCYIHQALSTPFQL